MAFADAVLGGLVVLLAFLLACFPARNSDVWLHLATGRSIAEGRFTFGADPFSYASEGAYWANHAWLGDLLGYLAFDAVGGAALVVLKSLLLAALAVLLIALGTPRKGERAGLWLPASCAALAILALAPWLQLRSTLLSYVLLALTCWVLEAWNRSSLLRVPWALGPLFAVWVNLDDWFLLGPLAVGLYAVGLALSTGFSSSGAAPGKVAPRLLALGAGLALGLLGCLASPHHVHSFALPSQLALTGGPRAFASSPLGGDLLLSPFSRAYFREDVGLNAAGLAYFLLVLLGAASFAVNRQNANGPRAVLWVSFFALSALRARAVPFFAVVAAPVVALNFAEALLRFCRERPPGDFKARQIVAGRLALLAAALMLLVLAWPGWLQARPHLRRGCGVEADPSLARIALQLGAWRRSGAIPGEARGFNVAPDVAHYLAWYCPEEQGFLDARLGLFSAPTVREYLALRAALLADGLDGEGPRETVRRYRVRHVVLYERGPDGLSAFRRLLASPDWALGSIEGGASVFFLRGPEGTGPKGVVPLSFEKLAFGSNGDKFAPASGPDSRPGPPDWLAPFRKAPAPIPADREETALWLACFDASRSDHQRRLRREWSNAAAAGLVGKPAGAPGAGCPGGALLPALAVALEGRRAKAPGLTFEKGYGEVALPAADRVGLSLWLRYLAGEGEGPPAALFLAVRAGRRAVRANPDDARASLLLGEAYFLLTRATSERSWAAGFPAQTSFRDLRRIQAITVFQTALRAQPDLAQAHARLSQLYRELGYPDLCLVHLRALLKQGRKGAPPAGEEEARQSKAHLEKLGEEVSQLSQQVGLLRERFEANSANLTVADKAATAQRQGLAETALALLLRSNVAAFGARGAVLELKLLLLTGRLPEARDWMSPEQEGLLGEETYRSLQLLIAAANGDYDRADEHLEALGKYVDAAPPTPGVSPVPLRDVMALLVAQTILDANRPQASLPQTVQNRLSARHLTEGTQKLAARLGEGADLLVVRGLLALERGEVAPARRFFEQALTLWKGGVADGTGLDFPSRAVAQRWLHQLNEANAEGPPGEKGP